MACISSQITSCIVIIQAYYTSDPDPDNAVQTPTTEYSYAFRLTEAYLLRAEAIALSNGDLSLAKASLKTVLSNTGVSNFTALDQQVLRQQLLKTVLLNLVARLEVQELRSLSSVKIYETAGR